MASILVDITLATTRRLQEAKSLQKKNSPTNLAPCPPFFVMPFFEGLAPGPNFPGQEKMVLLLLRPRRLRTESSSDTQGFTMSTEDDEGNTCYLLVPTFQFLLERPENYI